MRGRCETTYRELSAQGSRVLAVAYAVAPLQAAYSARDERELVLAGFVTFFDPPMKGVAETLRALRRDGVVVKILTTTPSRATRSRSEEHTSELQSLTNLVCRLLLEKKKKTKKEK